MSRVAHIMTPHPATIRVSATAAEASREMGKLQLRHLPVVDDAGKLVGILSDRDLRGPMIGADGAPPAGTAAVSTLMTRDVVTAGPDEDVGTVARRIIERRIGAVPVVDGAGVLVGILSYVDVLRRLADEADQDAQAVAAMDREVR